MFCWLSFKAKRLSYSEFCQIYAVNANNLVNAADFLFITEHWSRRGYCCCSLLDYRAKSWMKLGYYWSLWVLCCSHQAFDVTVVLPSIWPFYWNALALSQLYVTSKAAIDEYLLHWSQVMQLALALHSGCCHRHKNDAGGAQLNSSTSRGLASN